MRLFPVGRGRLNSSVIPSADQYRAAIARHRNLERQLRERGDAEARLVTAQCRAFRLSQIELSPAAEADVDLINAFDAIVGYFDGRPFLLASSHAQHVIEEGGDCMRSSLRIVTMCPHAR